LNDIQRALDLDEWLDLRIAQRLEQRLEQRLAKEREAWCEILGNRIVEERQQMIAIVEAEHRESSNIGDADVLHL
jgi:hypothetical protein